MRGTLAAACLAAALVASGCSQESATPPPEIDASDSTPPDSTTSGSPSAGASTPGWTGAGAAFDDRGHQAFPGRLAVRNDEQRAVADTWLAYWQLRLDSFHAVEADPAAIGETATGEAASDVIGYVRELERLKQRVDGDVRLSVADVRIDRDRATLTSCAENRTRNHGRNGPVEPLQPFYEFRAELSRVSERWRVEKLERIGTQPC